jgi:hypothetical protein
MHLDILMKVREIDFVALGRRLRELASRYMHPDTAAEPNVEEPISESMISGPSGGNEYSLKECFESYLVTRRDSRVSARNYIL